MLDLLSRMPRRLLFLKALSKKEILVPAYTRSDGTYVPAHYKHVNYNPDVDAVLSGKSSHSHKEALKKLSKVNGFKDLPAHEQHAHVHSLAQNIQTAASKAAQVSVFKKELLAGKKPKAANIAAFKELQASDPAKANAIFDSIIQKIGLKGYLGIMGTAPGTPAPEPAKPAGPTPEELAIAKDKLASIAGKAPGMHYPYLAWKKLADDVKTWGPLNAVEKLQAVVDLAKQMQAEATAAAKVSTLTKKLAEGKVPSPSELQAYQALDANGKLKAAQAAIKKSGGKQTFGTLAELMKQAEAKAGFTVDKPEKVSIASISGHFGQKHEGQPVGTGPGSATFVFEGGKWQFWNTSSKSWSPITNHEWGTALEQGIHPVTKQPLKVVPAPGTASSFGADNEGKVFAADKFQFMFADGEWQLRGLGEHAPWFKVTADEPIADLESGKWKGEPLKEVEHLNGGEPETEPPPEELPERDPLASNDEGWNHHAADPGFSGYPSLTFSDDTGTDWYVVGVDAIDADSGLFQVGNLHPETPEPDFEDAATPADVQAYFKKHGIVPPTKAAIAQLAHNWTGEEGPQEGDTKQGVGGVLTLKNGHWTLDNAAVLSFWSGHAIKPGSATSIATVGCLQDMANNSGPAQVSLQLINVKKAAQADGFAPAQINDLINDLNTIHAKVLDHELANPAASSGPVYDHKLTFTDAKSNKFWQVTVDADAKTATTTWGKIGATKPQSKTYKHPSAGAALKAAKDAAAAKKAKGYKTEFEHEPTEHVPGPAHVVTEKESFGAANAGKVFSAPMSTGAVGFYKFEGGQWHFSFDPLNDGWNPVDPYSQLHSALETGFNASKMPLEEADPDTPKWAFEPGQIFEAGYSANSSAKMTFKYAGDGEWETPHADGWTPVTVAAWKEALNSGKGLDGKPIAEVSSEPAAPAVDDGPHEGDIKPGKEGWLILKDGHWVKASLEEAIVKLCPVPEEISSAPLKNTLAELAKTTVLGAPIQKRWKKVATTKAGMPNVNLTIKPFGPFGNFGGKWIGRAKKTDLGKAGKWEGVVGQSGKNVAAALNWLEHVADVQNAFLTKKATVPPSPFAGQAATAPAAAPKGPIVPSAPSVAVSIDSWAKVGEQGGYNPGGTYTDDDGTKWYCKFPAGGEKVARNELLANKLYAAAGIEVPEVKLVSQGGKIGVASRIVVGAVEDKAALKAAKGEGLLSGFVADAWLANWDVVGNNPAAGKGWDNIMFKDGKAVRIDPGGSMLFSGAGSKKTTFGDDVIELETMRNAKINARTAKVFGGISDADLKASAEKVLSITDAQIEQMVKQHGPGDNVEKAALAKTLKARKAYIAAKFPSVAAKVAKAQAGNVTEADPGATKSGKMKAEKKIVFKPEELSAPPDFLNWSGPGKHGPATLEAKNVANQDGVNKLLEVAKKGDPELIKNVVFPLYDKDGNVAGSVSALDHPSQYVRGYAQQLINEIDFQLNPPKVFEFRKDSELGGLAAAFPTVKQITAGLKRLGKYVLLGESDGFPETEVASYPKQTFKNGKMTTSTFLAQSKSAWAKIPQLQRQAVQSYCGPKSGSINSALWAGNPAGQAASAMAALHTHAYELPAGVILSRKITLHSTTLEQMVGKDLVQGMAKTGQVGMGGATGKVLQEPAISSTSISPDVWSGNVHLKMIVGPGVKGLYAGSGTGISPHSGEKELLLPPNTRMLVKRVMKAPAGGDPDGFGKGSQYIVEVLLLPTEAH